MLVEVRDNGRSERWRSSVWKGVKFRIVGIVRLMIEWRHDRWNRIHTRTHIARNCTERESPRVPVIHPASQPDKRKPELWDPPMGVCSQDLRRWRYPFHTASWSFRSAHWRSVPPTSHGLLHRICNSISLGEGYVQIQGEVIERNSECLSYTGSYGTGNFNSEDRFFSTNLKYISFSAIRYRGKLSVIAFNIKYLILNRDIVKYWLKNYSTMEDIVIINNYDFS